MQLHLSSWPEIEVYLTSSKAILIPIGSTEQHGPNGLLGTDALCPEIIARRAGDESGILVGPTFNVGQAQHHMAFPGTITLRPSTMIAAMLDWAQSLSRHGFERIYWLNGHGGNIATINAAFSEIYHGVTFGTEGSNRPPLRCVLRNWWELAGVMDLCKQLFPVGEGSHATPSEVSVTYFGYPEAIKRVAMTPKIAPTGPIYDAEDYRRRFPDGRIGSDPSQATPEAGEKIVTAAVKGVIAEFQQFAAS
ncbi:MAG: creatininase family protein [Alphaproteobacteria bacterium]|nr:creatininase family protein [Alphaproteobacteria bacterium]MDE2501037.1 creatininase family protein [Alphaproteobacteria bacterium]